MEEFVYLGIIEDETILINLATLLYKESITTCLRLTKSGTYQCIAPVSSLHYIGD